MTREEIIAKAREAKSADELYKMAREMEGMEEFTEEDAKTCFDLVNRRGELSDEEIENAAGGCRKNGRLVTTLAEGACEDFICKKCHLPEHAAQPGGEKCNCYIFRISYTCGKCEYIIKEGGLWLCNNPKRIKH